MKIIALLCLGSLASSCLMLYPRLDNNSVVMCQARCRDRNGLGQIQHEIMLNIPAMQTETKSIKCICADRTSSSMTPLREEEKAND